jgi:hypothetical protein
VHFSEPAPLSPSSDAMIAERYITGNGVESIQRLCKKGGKMTKKSLISTEMKGLLQFIQNAVNGDR